MTQEEFGIAYTKGYSKTVRFLQSRGLYFDHACDVAQSAWAKGCEHLSQLRDPSMVNSWMNTIALNLYRTSIRKQPFLHSIPDTTLPLELVTAPKLHTTIDAHRILKNCRQKDRLVLEYFYLEGYRVQEIARAQGWSETAVRVRLSRARKAAGKLFTA